MSSTEVTWAIAAAGATAALEQLSREFSEHPSGRGARVIEGTRGFFALLVSGGEPSDVMARELLAHASPIFLLDFDDDAPSTKRVERRSSGAKVSRLREHPVEFLRKHGIVVPGYSPPRPPISTVGVIEDVSLSRVRSVMPKSEIEFRDHPRGVLVIDESGICTALLSRKLKKRAFVVMRDLENGEFSCSIFEPGRPAAEFSSTKPAPEFAPLDNVLGETTLAGILRILDIPAELLGLQLPPSSTT